MQPMEPSLPSPLLASSPYSPMLGVMDHIQVGAAALVTHPTQRKRSDSTQQTRPGCCLRDGEPIPAAQQYPAPRMEPAPANEQPETARK